MGLSPEEISDIFEKPVYDAPKCYFSTLREWKFSAPVLTKDLLRLSWIQTNRIAIFRTAMSLIKPSHSKYICTMYVLRVVDTAHSIWWNRIIRRACIAAMVGWWINSAPIIPARFWQGSGLVARNFQFWAGLARVLAGNIFIWREYVRPTSAFSYCESSIRFD